MILTKIDKRLSKIYSSAKNRCISHSPRNTEYYINKGIKFLLSKEDIYNLWIRDNAFIMEKPSLDRLDSNKNYCLDNCRFVEWKNHNKKETSTQEELVLSDASKAAKILGSIKTEKKATSSRINGKKGGRPKGSKNKVKND